jgi:hypothetical protein
MKRLLTLTLVLASVIAVPVCAQDHGPVQVSREGRHDTLRSLRDVMPSPAGFGSSSPPFLPLLDLSYGVVQGAADYTFAPSFVSGVDGLGIGFPGITTVDGTPPNPAGAVGATQYVQTATMRFAVFDKATKAPLTGAMPANLLWLGFGGPCETDNDGDAIVLYDKAADRWVISQFAIDAAPYYECVAVSQTSDATGAYNRYAFSEGTDLPDYPKMGVWPDAYYATFNMFDSDNFFGAKLCAYDRSSMLAGTVATQQCFQLSSSVFGILPADLDGTTAPPAGSPNYLLNFGTNSLNLWQFHVDWTTPANTTLSSPTNIPVTAFTPACPTTSACVPQLGVTQKLTSLGDRLMFRLAYRNFGAYESLVVNHSVQVGATADSSSGVRWYEIRSFGTPGMAPVVYQEATYSPDSSFRWMGSVAMDHQGNMALGYSVSSGTMSPAIRYTGRLASDALNTMQTEISLIEGTGSQTGFFAGSVWGFYSAMTIDPTDDCTFWYTNEYLKSNGFKWSTHIDSFKFASCGPIGPPAKLAFAVEPASSYASGTSFTVSVSIEDNDGNLVTSDNATQVSLTVNACGTTALGTVLTSGGIAQFTNLRFYTITDPNTLQLHAISIPALNSADSSAFIVTANADSVFWNGFDACTP